MQISQQTKPPIQFITVQDEYNSHFVESNNSFEIISELFTLGGSSCGQSQISQLTLANENDDDDESASWSACQPSLSRTYDSYADSASLDLRGEIISNDELSIDFNCDDSASFDLIGEMISKDELSIDYDDSASLDLIGDMISIDELSIDYDSSQSPSVIKNKHLSYESPQITPTFASTEISSICKASFPLSRRMKDIKSKRRSLGDKYQWHKLEPSMKPSRCNSRSTFKSTKISSISRFSSCLRMLKDMKNNLRSLKVEYQRQKFRRSKKDAVRCTDITSVVTDALDSRKCNELASKIRNCNLKKTLMTNILETGGAIICINMILGFFYFICTLYISSISAVMQGSNIALNSL